MPWDGRATPLAEFAFDELRDGLDHVVEHGGSQARVGADEERLDSTSAPRSRRK